ncbi:MAG TPA: DUF3618 domain-containing protein [Pseudonocardia sp.]
MAASNDPAQIRRDIERTQENLSEGVNAFAEKVSPARIVERRVDRARAAVRRVTDKIMGPDLTVPEATSGAATRLSDTASTAMRTAQDVPKMAREQAQGNPLAAGMIAFGAGLLVSSLIPSSRQEQRFAGQLNDRATDLAQPVAAAARRSGGDLGADLAEPARQAVEAVRSSAVDAGQTMADDARSAAADVRDTANESVTRSAR